MERIADIRSRIKQLKKLIGSKSELFAHLADCYVILGKHKEAGRLLLAGLEKHPRNVEGWLVQGNLYSNMNQPDNARNCFEQALEVTPDVLYAHEKCAEFALEKNDWDAYIRHMSDINRLMPLDYNTKVVLDAAILRKIAVDNGLYKVDEVGRVMPNVLRQTLKRHNLLPLQMERRKPREGQAQPAPAAEPNAHPEAQPEAPRKPAPPPAPPPEPVLLEDELVIVDDSPPATEGFLQPRRDIYDEFTSDRHTLDLETLDEDDLRARSHRERESGSSSRIDATPNLNQPSQPRESRAESVPQKGAPTPAERYAAPGWMTEPSSESGAGTEQSAEEPIVERDAVSPSPRDEEAPPGMDGFRVDSEVGTEFPPQPALQAKQPDSPVMKLLRGEMGASKPSREMRFDEREPEAAEAKPAEMEIKDTSPEPQPAGEPPPARKNPELEVYGGTESSENRPRPAPQPQVMSAMDMLVENQDKDAVGGTSHKPPAPPAPQVSSALDMMMEEPETGGETEAIKPTPPDESDSQVPSPPETEPMIAEEASAESVEMTPGQPQAEMPSESIGEPPEATSPPPLESKSGQEQQLAELAREVTKAPPATKPQPPKPPQPKPVRKGIATKTLAELHASQGEWAKAIDVYEQMLLKHPNNLAYRRRIEELQAKQASGAKR